MLVLFRKRRAATQRFQREQRKWHTNIRKKTMLKSTLQITGMTATQKKEQKRSNQSGGESKYKFPRPLRLINDVNTNIFSVAICLQQERVFTLCHQQQPQQFIFQFSAPPATLALGCCATVHFSFSALYILGCFFVVCVCVSTTRHIERCPCDDPLLPSIHLGAEAGRLLAIYSAIHCSWRKSWNGAAKFQCSKSVKQTKGKKKMEIQRTKIKSDSKTKEAPKNKPTIAIKMQIGMRVWMSKRIQ